MSQSKDLPNDYYEGHAVEYARSTFNLDVSKLRAKFLHYVKKKGLILDVGCGSGRDALAFLQDGYKVRAIDASKAMCEEATRNTGIEVIHQSALEITDSNTYDGIWASASLLHVPREQLVDVMIRLRQSLTSDGVIYASFKYGDFKGMRDGRYYNDVNYEIMPEILWAANLDALDDWISEDVRAGNKTEWLNVILCRRDGGRQLS